MDLKLVNPAVQLARNCWNFVITASEPLLLGLLKECSFIEDIFNPPWVFWQDPA